MSVPDSHSERNRLHRSRMGAILIACGMLLADSARAESPATRPATESLPGTLVTFDLVRLPGGMLLPAGEDNDARPVEVKPFWIGKTEVTWDLFDVWAF